MKYIAVVTVLFFGCAVSAQTVSFEAEAYSRFSIGSDPVPFAWGWLSWNSKKSIGLFVYTGIASPKWSVSTAGVSFKKESKDNVFETGVGVGIETPPIGIRGNAYLLLVYKKYSLYSYGEYGTSDPFWFFEGLYVVHDVVSIGIRNQISYVGPLIKFGNERISYWMSAGYDVDSKQSGVFIGLYTMVPVRKKQDSTKEP